MAEAFNFYFAIIEHDWKLTKKATGLDIFTENISYSLTILLELYWIIMALGRLNTVQHDPCAWLERGSWFFIMIFSPKLTRCWIQSSRLIVTFWVMQLNCIRNKKGITCQQSKLHKYGLLILIPHLISDQYDVMQLSNGL